MKISEASYEQKALILKAANAILKEANSSDNYDINFTKNHLILSEKGQKPPTAEQKELVKKLLLVHPLIGSVSTGTAGSQKNPAFMFSEIHEAYLSQSVAISVQQAGFKVQTAIKNLVTRILKGLKIEAHYWVDSNGDSIRICERKSSPPPAPVKTLMAAVLKVHPLFYNVFMGSITRDSIEYPTFFIKALDLAPLVGKKPEKMDNAIWAHMPFEIKRHWSEFNPDLQAHLIQYVQTLLAQVQQAQINKDSNSIDLSIFPFSVRLTSVSKPPATASAAGAAAASAEINTTFTYDLFKLLEIEDRDPHNQKLRRDPLLKGNYFSLYDISPPAVPVATVSLSNAASPSQNSGAAKATDEFGDLLGEPGTPLDDKYYGPDDDLGADDLGLYPHDPRSRMRPYSYPVDSPSMRRLGSDDSPSLMRSGSDDSSSMMRSGSGGRGLSMGFESGMEHSDLRISRLLLDLDDFRDRRGSRMRLPYSDDYKSDDMQAMAHSRLDTPRDVYAAPVQASFSVASATPAKAASVAASGTPAPATSAKAASVAASGTPAPATSARAASVAASGTPAPAASAKAAPVGASNTHAPIAASVKASQAQMGMFGQMWTSLSKVAQTAVGLFASQGDKAEKNVLTIL